VRSLLTSALVQRRAGVSGPTACSLLRLIFCVLVFLCCGTACQSPATPIVWRADLDAALSDARAAHRPALIDFTASWCAACGALEERTYVDAQVQRKVARFVAIKVDASVIDDRMQALFDRYGIASLPAVVFVDSQGNVRPTPRLKAFVEPASFLEMLGQVS
jgi:thiol:disulfide interchange protein DsbD